MTRIYYTLIAFAAAFVLVSIVIAVQPAHAQTKKRPECEVKCQRSNDYYLTDFTDYFVNDSDGQKDAVFTIFHRVPIGEKRCEVVKTYESDGDGVALQVVCP